MQAKNLGTFKELLWKTTNLKQHVIVGVCPKLMYLVTKVVPGKEQTAQAPVAKRPHDGAEMGPRKKLRKAEGREQGAPRKEKTPRSSEKRHHHRADEVSHKVRKDEGREYKDEGKQKPVKTILPGEQEKRQPQIVLAQQKLPRPDLQKKISHSKTASRG